MNDQSKLDGNLLPVPLPDQPGVLRTDIDTANHALMIDFDPRLISDEGVRKVAEKLAPIGHQQYCKTILHLGGRASGAAEQKLEKKAQRIDGRRARATFLGGVMTVTFDDARLSEAQVIERVRETGASVKPYSVEAEYKPATVHEWLAHWTTGDRLEAVFTVLTFVFMITGWASARLSVAWHDVFYAGAYLTGGYFGVRAWLQSLRQWTIDVDYRHALPGAVNPPKTGKMRSLSSMVRRAASDPLASCQSSDGPCPSGQTTTPIGKLKWVRKTSA